MHEALEFLARRGVRGVPADAATLLLGCVLSAAPLSNGLAIVMGPAGAAGARPFAIVGEGHQ